MSNASFNWHAKTPPPRTQPIIPVAGSHTPDLSGLLGSLHITQHVLEMFHGTLPAGPQNRLLDRLPNRLTRSSQKPKNSICPGNRKFGRDWVTYRFETQSAGPAVLPKKASSEGQQRKTATSDLSGSDNYAYAFA